MNNNPRVVRYICILFLSCIFLRYALNTVQEKYYVISITCLFVDMIAENLQMNYLEILFIYGFLMKFLVKNINSCECWQKCECVNVTGEKFRFFRKKLISMIGSDREINFLTLGSYITHQVSLVVVKNSEKKKIILVVQEKNSKFETRYDLINLLYNFGSVIIFDPSIHGYYSKDHDLRMVYEYIHHKLNIDANNLTFYCEHNGCIEAIDLICKLSKTMIPKNYIYGLILVSPLEYDSVLYDIFVPYDLEQVTEFVENIFFMGNSKLFQNINFMNHFTKVIIAYNPKNKFSHFFNQRYKKMYGMFNCNGKQDINMVKISGTEKSIELSKDFLNSLIKLLQV